MNAKYSVFKSLHISHLDNGSAVTLFYAAYETALPVRGYIGTTADSILSDLIRDAAACSEQVGRQRKNALSDDVKALRKTCLDLFAEIKRTIVFAAKSRVEHLHAAGEELKFFFEPFWNIPKKALEVQMDMTVGLQLRYNTQPEIRMAAQVIGIDTLMTDFEITNSRLLSVYLDRNEEVGARPASGTDLRPAANESYMQFCTAIEQAVRYTPNEELIGLFQLMNVQRKAAHKLMASRESRKKES